MLASSSTRSEPSSSQEIAVVLMAVLAQEIAVVLMADCSGHLSNDVIRILTETRVSVINFAPDIIQVFQVLDLTMSCVSKRCARYELPFDHDSATVRVLMKVYHGFTQTLVPSNAWVAFPALTVSFATRREWYRLLFDKVKLRESAGFQEPSSVDFALDQLSDWLVFFSY
jgi:hypothetical protein